MRILFAGEVMGELRRNDTGYALGFAGDTFNAAVYCKRLLGKDGHVSYLTRVGTDPMSQGALDLAEAEGLDTSSIQRDTRYNLGLYAVATDAEGERSFSYWRDQSAARQLFSDPAELDALEQTDLLCLSGITLAILSPQQREELFQRIAELRDAGTLRLVFDDNYRPALWESPKVAQQVMTQAWCLTDVALPSVDDEMALFGDADEAAVLARLRGLGVTDGALKRAASGPVPINPDVQISAPYPAAERVVDTTAAGDSFNGGFLAALMQGAPTDACLMQGHMMAREVVGHPGAIIPNRKDN
ncbi:sugar kinase [Aliiroseovarius halocynthiae]|uniref:Sugar kinase n=2 Tax=Aliiroseovarius halocynthiae TaxID=985055 RepID=A0A545SL80_9RHOB|nr:sugar kinase [Aliiroseovarius halocynthiae]